MGDDIKCPLCGSAMSREINHWYCGTYYHLNDPSEKLMQGRECKGKVLRARTEELLVLLKEWYRQADAGEMDGVDLRLMVATFDAIAKHEGGEL